MEILLVLQIIVVVALIAVILVQKTGSDGFTGGGSANSFLTGRASANLFTRTTSILATIFIVNSLVLAYIASHSERAGSIIEQAAEESETAKKNGEQVPANNLGDLQNKLNNIHKGSEETPAQPAEDSKPAEAPKESAPSVPAAE